ncbi:hypothetical protein CIHG_03057 [Coccidioides immitis H538.4]|uniref:Uncharacterized protein n=2 Tax=Coccidioides immitis TaxID=5501 RepID=A0A0J8R6V2_COCIT|nr:hypothetical protein CISG_08697 [Coccidioides immitis RMSCC 3703]KMU85273.1 hypothetical protein CIHG_03057 [Coccidioides immitis H538.4]
MKLEQIEQALPDFDSEKGRVEDGLVAVRPPVSVSCTGGCRMCRLSRALPLWALPVAVPLLSISHCGKVSLGSSGAGGADCRCGIDALSARGLAGAAGGVDTRIDAFDLAPPAAGASNARAHLQCGLILFLLHGDGFNRPFPGQDGVLTIKKEKKRKGGEKGKRRSN